MTHPGTRFFLSSRTKIENLWLSQFALLVKLGAIWLPATRPPQAISEGSNNVRYAVLQTVEPCGWPECCKSLFEGLEA